MIFQEIPDFLPVQACQRITADTVPTLDQIQEYRSYRELARNKSHRLVRSLLCAVAAVALGKLSAAEDRDDTQLFDLLPHRDIGRYFSKEEIDHERLTIVGETGTKISTSAKL
jgi:hypothetical protein